MSIGCNSGLEQGVDLLLCKVDDVGLYESDPQVDPSEAVLPLRLRAASPDARRSSKSIDEVFFIGLWLRAHCADSPILIKLSISEIEMIGPPAISEVIDEDMINYFMSVFAILYYSEVTYNYGAEKEILVWISS